MDAWDKLTRAEKSCYYFLRNGFKQCEIAILKNIETGVVRGHMHNGKNKAKCDTIDEALGDFCTAKRVDSMHPDEKKKYRNIIALYVLKYGKKKV